MKRNRIAKFIILYLLIVTAATFQGRSAKAATDPVVWYCVQENNKFESDTAVRAYVSARDVTMGKVSKDGKNAIGLPELTAAATQDRAPDYYLLPNGYCVTSGTSISLQRVNKAGLNVANYYYYSYVKGNRSETYTDLTFSSDKTTYTVSSNVTFGSSYNVDSIAIEEYKSPSLDYTGNEIMGTEVQKSYFTVTAELASGSSVTLGVDEFNIAISGADDLKVPKNRVKETDTVSFVATYPIQGLSSREFNQSTTYKKMTGLSAEWDGTTYHVGDTIKTSSIKAVATYYDVIQEKEITEKVNTNNTEFSFSPATIQLAGKNLIAVYYKNFETTCEITGYGISELMVSYPNTELVVGSNIETDKIKVYAKYSNGDQVQIKEGWTISNTLVATTGENVFTITYNYGYGMVTKELVIRGVERSISKITATYKGEKLPVDSSIQIADIVVMATYNDKTEEQVYGFLLSQSTITKIGKNVITITYLSHTTTVTIEGTEKIPNTITAVYNGNTVIAGSDIDTNNITVTAYYNDGTFDTVTDFSLSSKTLTGVGVNVVTVTYKKATTTIYVVCIAREATKIEAQYKGPNIEQGNSFSRDNLIVTATFNDNTTEQVTDFLLTTSLVEKIGTNVFTVSYGTTETTFTVIGYPKTISGTGVLTAEIGNEDYEGLTLVADIDEQLVKENITLEVSTYETAELKKLVRKTTRKGQFVAFEVDIDGYEFTENQYLTAKITVPVGFEPSKVAVFYTPNRRSVMARLGGGLVSSSEYEFYAYKSGTYVILECDDDMVSKTDFRNNFKPEPFLLVKNLKAKIKVGEKINLESSVMYGDEKQTAGGVKYLVDDSSVAKVTNNGVLLGRSEGDFTLTVKSADGSMKATFNIEVVSK